LPAVLRRPCLGAKNETAMVEPVLPGAYAGHGLRKESVNRTSRNTSERIRRRRRKHLHTARTTALPRRIGDGRAAHLIPAGRNRRPVAFVGLPTTPSDVAHAVRRVRERPPRSRDFLETGEDDPPP